MNNIYRSDFNAFFMGGLSLSGGNVFYGDFLVIYAPPTRLHLRETSDGILFYFFSKNAWRLHCKIYIVNVETFNKCETG